MGVTRRQLPVVLVVDDQATIRLLLKHILEAKAGVRVIWAATSRYGLKLARRRKVDLVISDLVRPGKMVGLKFAQALNRIRPGLPVIIFSGSLTPAISREARRLGVFCCLQKGGPPFPLLKRVTRALSKACSLRPVPGSRGGRSSRSPKGKLQPLGNESRLCRRPSPFSR